MVERRRLLLGVSTVAGLGLVGVRPARASCIGPELVVDGRRVQWYGGSPAGPVPLRRGRAITVEGRWFFDGCEDSRPGGCAPMTPTGPPDRELPQRGVELRLEQGGRSWRLGVADAASRDQEYAIRWRVTVPDAAVDGSARLTAGPSTTVALRLIP